MGLLQGKVKKTLRTVPDLCKLIILLFQGRSQDQGPIPDIMKFTGTDQSQNSGDLHQQRPFPFLTKMYRTEIP